MFFKDRAEAGQMLASRLKQFAGQPKVLVLALPRGGVPVGFEIASRLRVPLDVFVVRKLGVPGHEELALGALAADGTRVINDDVVESLRIPSRLIEAIAAQQAQEIHRRELEYRDGRSAPDIQARTILLVDDGLATGSTMRVAIRAIRRRNPDRIIAAIPVASPPTLEEVAREADAVICLATPEQFFAVGQWYRQFEQTTDDEVRRLLAQAVHSTTQQAA